MSDGRRCRKCEKEMFLVDGFFICEHCDKEIFSNTIKIYQEMKKEMYEESREIPPPTIEKENDRHVFCMKCKLYDYATGSRKVRTLHTNGQITIANWCKGCIDTHLSKELHYLEGQSTKMDTQPTIECPTCEGDGDFSWGEKCHKCQGTGRVPTPQDEFPCTKYDDDIGICGVCRMKYLTGDMTTYDSCQHTNPEPQDVKCNTCGDEGAIWLCNDCGQIECEECKNHHTESFEDCEGSDFKRIDKPQKREE